MDRRNLLAGLVVLALGVMVLGGSAWAHGTVKGADAEGEGSCTVKSLPSFVAQGEFEFAATVGDVIEVSCDPYKYSQGAEATLTASQLYSRCHEIYWVDPNDEGRPIEYEGRSFSVHLDVDGNANVGLIAGPRCMVGESLITLDENEPPYETFTTSFQVLPAVNTPQGLYITPSSQVEDAESSSVVTIAQAEFPGNSEKTVRIASQQLYDRCHYGGLYIVPAYSVINEPGLEKEGYGELLEAIYLDNNGNGFVLLVGVDSCAEGTSLVEADLESSPFTTETGTFTIEAPRPRIGG
jgi:hypothetical protein